MKRWFNLTMISFLLPFLVLVLVKSEKAGEAAPPPDLLSMINTLEKCQRECEASRWYEARLSLNNLKANYAELLPKLLLLEDKSKVSSFGIFLTKLERSIQAHDPISSMQYLKILSNIVESLRGHFQAK